MSLRNVDISVLIGQTLKEIHQINDVEIHFITSTEKIYQMKHIEDCCEDVSIDEIVGDMDWLIGTPILVAEERTNSDNPRNEKDESFTWTFYELATIKGSVTIRWYGESNGYYSESVDVMEVE